MKRVLAFALLQTAMLLSGAEHPNVLFIVVDDLNVALGCYGNREVRTPNIDRLAERGVRFDRAYCQYPLCNPSRVSVLTGRRPESTGVYVLSKSARAAVPHAVMLPQFFRSHGYAAVGHGKVFHSEKMNDAASWDGYYDGDGEDPQEQAAIKSRYGGGDGRPAWTELEGDGARTRDGLVAGRIAALMREYAAAGRPYFLAAGFHKPHLPWTAPKCFFDLYRSDDVLPPREPDMTAVPAIALQTELSGFAQPENRAAAIRAYYACVSFIDAQIGRLLDELDRQHLWESTIVVLWGDNGFHLGDHGGLWAKLSAFDASTHVPLIFAGAGVPRQKVVTQPVELLDIYPTLVDLTGQVPPAGLEGQSLAPLWRGETTAPRLARSMVFHLDPERKQDVLGRTLIAADWRYTEWGDGARSEFYLRASDPAEYANRVSDPAVEARRQAAAAALRALPAPKAGPANRARALAEQIGVDRVN